VQASDPRGTGTLDVPAGTPGSCGNTECCRHSAVLTAIRCAALLEPFRTHEVMHRFDDTPAARTAEAYLEWLTDGNSALDACLRQEALCMACERLSAGHAHQEALAAAKVLYAWMTRERDRRNRDSRNRDRSRTGSRR
jgi:hypothetical protein